MAALPTTKEAWLSMRKNYIGASEAPIIMNGSHFDMTPYKLWQQKLGLRDKKADTFVMQRGRLNEEPARQKYEQMTNSLVAPEIVFHKKHKFMMATLDGLSPRGDMAVEIKCPGEKDHAEASRGNVPEKYYAQLQHQLACADLDMMHYFSYRDDDGILIEVTRDDAFIENLYKMEQEFWDKVLNLEAPKLLPCDVTDMSNCNEWKLAAKSFRLLDKQLLEIQKKRDACKNQLISLAKDQNSEGHGIKLTKILRKGIVDYKSIPVLQSIDVEQYRKKPSTYWSCILC